MATSITSAGIVFPDSTVQTTAAGAGGSSLEAVASGSLSDGSTVIVNSDGTVSVVASSGAAQSVGSTYNWAEGSRDNMGAVYDPVNNAVVIGYSDTNNSDYGTAIVGTVSGTTISFGSPVVFRSAAVTTCAAAYHTTQEKVVIGWREGGTAGRVIAGAVSGTSISFGGYATFNPASTSVIRLVYHAASQYMVAIYRDAGFNGYGNCRVFSVSGTSISIQDPETTFNPASSTYIGATYDPVNEKIVVVFNDTGETRGVACVGTLSGTTMSWGATSYVNTGNNQYNTATYDASSGKIVASYTYGTEAFVSLGTVSGTSISFGSEVVFNDAYIFNTTAVYDSAAEKVILSYRDGDDKGKIRAVKVSGSSVTFDDELAFTSSAIALILTSTYDSTAQKTFIGYRDNATGWPYALMYTADTFSTNLTSENFIGISDGVYSDGQTATVQLLGSVDDAQTSLTPGQKYYVQPDGSLSVTPGSPEVLAGTAVATTKLVIKR